MESLRQRDPCSLPDSSCSTCDVELDSLKSLVEVLQDEKGSALQDMGNRRARLDGIFRLQELPSTLSRFPSCDELLMKLLTVFDDEFHFQSLNHEVAQQAILRCASWIIRFGEPCARLAATDLLSHAAADPRSDGLDRVLGQLIIDLVPVLYANMRFASADYLTMKTETIGDAALVEQIKALGCGQPAVSDPVGSVAENAWGSTWTLRKASAELLEHLSHGVHRQIVVRLVMPLIELGMRDSSWDARECAVLALGAIAALGSAGLVATMHEIARSHLKASRHPLERSICCWTLGRYAGDISLMHWDEDSALKLTVSALLTQVLDSTSSVVRKAACTALCAYFESDVDMAPYVEDTIKVITNATDIYSESDMGNLVDLGITLVEKMGTSFATGSNGDILLRAWFSMLSKEIDDKGLAVIFEGMVCFAEKGSDLFFKEASLVISKIERVMCNYLHDDREQTCKRPRAVLSGSSGCMVVVRMINGRQLASLSVDPDDKVAALRSAVSTDYLNGRPCCLVLGDSPLRDAATMAESGIRNDSCITALVVQNDSTIVNALDLLTAIVEGFGERICQFLSQEQLLCLITMIKRCLNAASSDVRRSAFACVGSLLHDGPALYKSQFHDVLPACSKGVLDESRDVCQNASWSLGMACETMESAGLNPYVEQMSTALCQAYKDELFHTRELRENLEETLRRLGQAPERFRILAAAAFASVASASEMQKSNLRESYTQVLRSCFESLIVSSPDIVQQLSAEVRCEFRL